MSTWPDFGSQRLSAIMFMVAAAVFLLTSLFGDAGGEVNFLILAVVFVVLSVNTWQSSRT